MKSLLISLSHVGYLTIFSAIALPIKAQITSDNTVSTEVNQSGNIFEITGGETRGSNLFHSFQEFSVNTGNEAFFNNANAISNIFSRVTGGNVSNIDGLIRANGSASLFLINPAGIIFGNNASLDIGGSFYGSSADSILFEDGEFSATDLDTPLLTIKAPIGLGFRDNPGDIVNSSINDDVGLQVSNGATLALIGGNINLEGGLITVPGGNVELGGLAEAGEININNSNSLSFPEGTDRGNVSLSDRATVNVRAGSGGFINVNARNLTLSEQSELFAGIAEDMGSSQAQAGDININATESVRLVGEPSTADPTAPFNDFLEQLTIERDNATGIRNNVGLPSARRNPATIASSALGNGGKINIFADRLELTDIAVIDSSLLGQGNGGTINLNADRIFLNGGALLTQVRGFNLETIKESAIGDAGDVNINTGSFVLNNPSAILADVQSDAVGTGGDINVNASREVVINNLLLTQLGGNARGSAGNINIAADSLSMQQESSILQSDVQPGGNGDGGDITLDIQNNIILNNGLILSQIQNEAIGNGGDIKIDAANFTATNDFQILADIRGQGNAGDITIDAENSLSISESLVLSQIRGVGDGGDITIVAGDSVSISGGSLLLADSGENAIGNAGNITIDAENSLSVSESQILSQINGEAVGNAGEIELTANLIEIENFSLVSTSVQQGTIGRTGSVNLSGNTVKIGEGAIVDALTENESDGGNIFVEGNNLEIVAGGKIVTSTNNTGSAGNIDLEITESIVIDGTNTTPRPEEVFAIGEQALNELELATGLFANTSAEATGNGGNITIGSDRISQTITLADNAQISVDSQGLGSGGIVSSRSNFLDLINSSMTAATASERGGNIDLTVTEILSLSNNSLISAEATGDADGGNVNIDTKFIVATPNQNSDILASAEAGMGGNINITAESLFGIQQRQPNPVTNDIDASSDFGLDGTVSIIVPDVDAIERAAELPSNIIEPDRIVTQACPASSQKLAGESSLEILGKGGVPASPTAPLGSDLLLTGDGKFGQEADSESVSAADIVPARGVIVTEEGRVILTAYETTGDRRHFIGSVNCGS